jgi:transcriptional regulator with XRE-family HTH domain
MFLRRPEVWTQVRAADCPPGGALDPLGQHGPASGGTFQEVVEMGVIDSQFPGKGCSIWDPGSKVGHGFNVDLKSRLVKSRPDGLTRQMIDPGPMTDWPQRTEFRKALDSYRLSEGITLEELARILEIKLSTLHTYLYAKKGKPSLELLQRVSKLTNKSILYLIDDPGSDTLGTRTDEETRFFSRLIIRDMAAEDLTPEDKKALYDAWRWHLDQIRRARPRPSPAD